MSADVPERLPDAVYANAVIELAPPRALVRIPGVARYLVDAAAPVRVAADSSATELDIACFRDGPVRALQLLLDGVFALRGAAVRFDTGAVLICGAPAAGKSALAAALAQRGHAVLADKLVPVAPGGTVLPTADAVELWPPMAAQLAARDGAVVRPGLAKRAYSLGPARDGSATPVHAIVLLVVDPRVAAVEVTAVHGLAQRLPTIATWQAHRRLVPHLARPREQLDWLAALAGVSMIKLSRPRRGNTVASLADLVEEHAA